MILLAQDFYEIRTTEKKGSGIFALREIAPGTIIGDYLGRIIDDAEGERLGKELGACYDMDYDGHLSIFPLDIKAPGVHLINHSCSPNTNTYYYYGHTLFFALRRILPGEEITLDYGLDPDQEVGFVYPCYCHSPLCRGTMYINPERLKQYGHFSFTETAGQVFEHLPVGAILEPLAEYPPEIKDNSVFDLFAKLDAEPIVYLDEKLPDISEIRKRLRETGSPLAFTRLGLTVWGVVDSHLILK